MIVNMAHAPTIFGIIPHNSFALHTRWPLHTQIWDSINQLAAIPEKHISAALAWSLVGCMIRMECCKRYLWVIDPF